VTEWLISIDMITRRSTVRFIHLIYVFTLAFLALDAVLIMASAKSWTASLWIASEESWLDAKQQVLHSFLYVFVCSLLSFLISFVVAYYQGYYKAYNQARLNRILSYHANTLDSKGD
jgi:ABC-type Fe3+ transport system permease subunit